MGNLANIGLKNGHVYLLADIDTINLSVFGKKYPKRHFYDSKLIHTMSQCGFDPKQPIINPSTVSVSNRRLTMDDIL